MPVLSARHLEIVIRGMMATGFSRDQVVRALDASDNDPDRAMELLRDGQIAPGPSTDADLGSQPSSASTTSSSSSEASSSEASSSEASSSEASSSEASSSEASSSEAPLTKWLDGMEHPKVLVAIMLHCDYHEMLTFRQTSRLFQAVVDNRLFAHMVAGTSPDGLTLELRCPGGATGCWAPRGVRLPYIPWTVDKSEISKISRARMLKYTVAVDLHGLCWETRTLSYLLPNLTDVRRSLPWPNLLNAPEVNDSITEDDVKGWASVQHLVHLKPAYEGLPHRVPNSVAVGTKSRTVHMSFQFCPSKLDPEYDVKQRDLDNMFSALASDTAGCRSLRVVLHESEEEPEGVTDEEHREAVVSRLAKLFAGLVQHGAVIFLIGLEQVLVRFDGESEQDLHGVVRERTRTVLTQLSGPPGNFIMLSGPLHSWVTCLSSFTTNPYRCAQENEGHNLVLYYQKLERTGPLREA